MYIVSTQFRAQPFVGTFTSVHILSSIHFLAMTKLKRALFCLFGLTETLLKILLVC